MATRERYAEKDAVTGRFKAEPKGGLDEQLIDNGSPTIELIKRRYKKQYAFDQWDNNRVARLCRAANLTLFELCALAGFYERRHVKEYWNKVALGIHKHWPTWLVIPFSKVERFVYERRVGVVGPPDAQDIETARVIAKL